MDPEDARLAVDAGADAVVVSNHGGRQLDGVPASIDVLPRIREAVPETSLVLLDSGVRTGGHILRALALGADGVLVGRAAMYGLAAGGEAGVDAVLTLLRTELDTAMALAGCPDLAGIRRLHRWGGPDDGSVVARASTGDVVSTHWQPAGDRTSGRRCGKR
jgi:isopentenyl diphosphate isomerase/L-lactate dehydrogenase-like FMN-dependent dehydrogenase